MWQFKKLKKPLSHVSERPPQPLPFFTLLPFAEEYHIPRYDQNNQNTISWRCETFQWLALLAAQVLSPGILFLSGGWQEDRSHLLSSSGDGSGWQGAATTHKNWKHSASGRGDWHGNAFTGFFIIVSTAFYRPPCWSFYHISLGRRCPITVSWSHCSLEEFWDDQLSHGAACSHPLVRGQTRGVGLLPPIEIETALVTQPRQTFPGIA